MNGISQRKVRTQTGSSNLEYKWVVVLEFYRYLVMHVMSQGVSTVLQYLGN